MNAVERLLAEADIARLITRYAVLNDAGEFDAVAAMYLENGVYVRPSANVPVIGRAAILASFKARPPRTSCHLITNVIIDIDSAESATARSTMLLYTASPGSTPAVARGPGLLGGFADRLLRDRNEWRFAERRGWIDLSIGEQE